MTHLLYNNTNVVGINVIYDIFKHIIEIDGKQIETYGIAVRESGKTVKTVFDVSVNCDAVISLVNRLNEGQVELIHFESVLEDFFVENP